MTIDEAIKRVRSYELINSMEEKAQIAEWLEELKAIKSDGFTDNLLDMGFTKGYNKAIDDFTERLKPIIDEKIKGWTNSDDLRRWCERSIDEISEQLKAGVKNE